MKKKGIMISFLGIILLIALLVVLINVNRNNKYLMQNGMMLALTLNGEEIENFPEGKNYHVQVKCKNAKGTWLVEDWRLGVENITGKVRCNIDFTTLDDSYKLTSVIENAIPDNNYDNNGYRYSGKNPDNYIWFNNEMWRIIGSIPTCTTASCGTNGTNLVKVIRYESIGQLLYDIPATLDYDAVINGLWGENTLYTLLNTYYYASDITNMNGQSYNGCYSYYAGYASQANCDYAGIGILSNSYYGQMVENVFWNTGVSANNVMANTAFNNEVVNQTVSGYVGLMSMSDYGYAADNTSHSSTMDNYGSFVENIWLFNGVEFTTTGYNENQVNYLSSSGRFYAGGSGELALAVHPVVYLDPSVYVLSGTGTVLDPYMIGTR